MLPNPLTISTKFSIEEFKKLMPHVSNHSLKVKCWGFCVAAKSVSCFQQSSSENIGHYSMLFGATVIRGVKYI